MPFKDPEKQKAAQQAWYLRNKIELGEKNKSRKRALNKFINDYKESNPCADCGISYPYFVMDFDHLKDKIANVSHIKRHGTIRQAKEEIAKCDLVCSNCHRVRGWLRQQAAIV